MQKTQEGYQVLPSIDKARYDEIQGMEGPFMTRSGKVVYYDPQEGAYYDRDTDMYLTYDEWRSLDEGYEGDLHPSIDMTRDDDELNFCYDCKLISYTLGEIDTDNDETDVVCPRCGSLAYFVASDEEIAKYGKVSEMKCIAVGEDSKVPNYSKMIQHISPKGAEKMKLPEPDYSISYPSPEEIERQKRIGDGGTPPPTKKPTSKKSTYMKPIISPRDIPSFGTILTNAMERMNEAPGDVELLKPMVDMDPKVLPIYAKNIIKKYPHLKPSVNAMIGKQESVATEGEAGDHDRMYKVVHVKKGMMDIKAKTSYEAAKKFAKEKGLKSTAGVDVHLYPLEEAIPKSTMYGLVIDGEYVAKGSKADMMKMKKEKGGTVYNAPGKKVGDKAGVVKEASSPWTSSKKHPEDMSREELQHEIDIFKQYKKAGMSLSPKEIMQMDSLYDYLDTVDDKIKVTNIKWDSDDDVSDLSTTMMVPVPPELDDEEAEEFIANYITDKTGITHDGFKIDEDATKRAGDAELLKPMINMDPKVLPIYAKNIIKKYPHMQRSVNAMLPRESVAEGMMDDEVKAILMKYPKELEKLKASEDLMDVYDTPLYQELFSYYADSGEMPYDTMKARDGDPVQFIQDELDDMGVFEGFASDAQRKAAFASGYDPKKKKKNETVDISKLKASINMTEATDSQAVAGYVRTLLNSSHNTWKKVDEEIDFVINKLSEGHQAYAEEARTELHKRWMQEYFDNGIKVSENVDTMRKIVKNKSAMPVKFSDGTMKVDMTSANIFLQAYDKMKERNQEKINQMMQTKAGFLRVMDFIYGAMK